MSEQSVESWYETADKDGMTLAELAAWVQEAQRSGVPDTARPTVWLAGVSRRVKKIEIAPPTGE